jgi:hypothetical protein
MAELKRLEKEGALTPKKRQELGEEIRQLALKELGLPEK